MSETGFCLANGLTICSDTMKNIETVTVSVLVKTGSRNEGYEVNGISHFLEHMAFKGTETRTALKIAEEFDNIGGYFNAYTSRERTVYYAKVLKEDLHVAVDILADILQNSVFLPDEIEKERGVIMQEIAQTEDTPDDLIFDHFQEVAYPNQPFGRSILGTVDFIKSVTRDQIQEYVHTHYTYNNTIIAGAGNLDNAKFNALITNKFNKLPVATKPTLKPANYTGGERRTVKDLEQVHIVLGLKSVPYLDPDYYTQQVLSIILGGGMSSRLFQEVREKRGLAYTISTFTSNYSDCGIFGMYSGTSENKANELLDVLCDELLKITSNIKDEEVIRAKVQLKASLLMGQESSVARAEKLVSNYAAYGRFIPVHEIISKIEAVNRDSLISFAKRLFSHDSIPTLVSIGRVDRLKDMSEVVKRLVL